MVMGRRQKEGNEERIERKRRMEGKRDEKQSRVIELEGLGRKRERREMRMNE